MKHNFITRKYVHNIPTKFELLHKYKLHDADVLTVDIQVKQFVLQVLQKSIRFV